MLNKEELFLCALLREALAGEGQEKGNPEEIDFKKVISIAESHRVISLLYDVLEGESSLPKETRRRLEKKSREIVQQNYRLLFLTRYLVKILEEAGLSVIVLKGSSTASYYPVPELRKTGDVDLLLRNEEDAERGAAVLEQAGFKRGDEQDANHHIACFSPEGIEIELHLLLTEPFDTEKINRYLKTVQARFFEKKKQGESMGVTLPVLSEAHHAFYLLLHMLQHFLRSGFGLKLLCDWTVFLNRMEDGKEQEEFLEIAQGCGLLGFTRMVTAVCVKYFGLSPERAAFLDLEEWMQDKYVQEFLQEILEAEEFGRGETDRMVVLRGTGPMAYLRELHHQMKLTYPRAGKYPVLYPVLWCAMLIGFLWRNWTLRKVPSRDILRKAGRRSRFVKKMKLFQRSELR